ncbi:MAG: mechanosensitive ion channel family protein [Geminicoccaceae bacterium]
MGGLYASLNNCAGIIVCLLTIAFTPTASVGQALDSDISSEFQVTSPQSNAPIASVSIDGQVYFKVRGSLSIEAQERADTIEKRIIDVARSSDDPEPLMRIRSTNLVTEIYADGALITGVSASDAALEGFDIELVADFISERIADAIRDYRVGRSVSSLGRGLQNALIWSLGFVAVVGSLLFLWRYWRRYADVRVRKLLRDVERRTGRVVDPGALTTVVRLLSRGVLIFVIVILTYYYIAFVLYEFGYTKAFARLLINTLAAPLLALAHGTLNEIPDLITLIIIILIFRYLLRVLHLFFVNIDNGVIQLEGFRPEWVWPSHRLIRAVVFLCALVICYPYIPGAHSNAFKGMTIFLGLVISIGSNSVMSNLLAGLIVIYKHSLNVGDRIRVEGIVGGVERVTLLDTLVRTPKNEMVSLPNSTLLNSNVINYTQTKGTDGLRIYATVGIGYEEKPEVVERLLIRAAEATPGLKADPLPFVLRTNLGSHDVSYEVNACLAEGYDAIRARSELNAQILDAFNAAGVQIMTPFYVADPDHPKVPAKPSASDDTNRE